MLANQIDVVDEIVAGVSLVGALLSLVVSWVAARRGLIRFRTLHAAVAAMSTVYVAGYLWLMLGNPAPAFWSSVMRGFSLVAWGVVWIAPAVVSLTVARDLHAAVRKRTLEGGEEPE